MGRATRRTGFLCAALALLGVADARAVPDLRLGRQAGPLRVFPDDRRPGLFYYPPGDLQLVTDAAGKPDFQFLQLRYTGTEIEGDTGVRRFRNIVAMRIALSGPTPAEVRAARTALGGGAVELRPLPVSRLEAVVVYAPAGSRSTPDGATALPAGQFEAQGSAGLSSATAFWSERVFSLRLDNGTAQLFDSALRRGLLVLSLGYAFFASGIGADRPLAELSGDPQVVAALRERAGLAGDSAQAGDTTAGHLVRAGAIAIDIDAARWPDLVRQIDLNAQMPPGYPMLLVYCYDFRDALNDSLHAKLVQFQAVGVAGRPVSVALMFSRAQPELYARTVRFPYAVQLARPYRYRVTEVTHAGAERAGPWVERDSWSGMLDVTTPAPADSAGPHP